MTNTENSPVVTDRTRRLVGWRIAAWTGAGLVLLLPLIAMRFTAEVQWTGLDFVAAGVLLAALVGAFELVVRLTGDWMYRGAVVVAAGAAVVMLWAQGAVGLTGSENDLFNLLFLLPLLVGATGCLIAGFRAGGMSRTLWAMAAVQAATVVVGYAVTRDTDAVLMGLWVAAWALSAWLFGRSALKGEARS